MVLFIIYFAIEKENKVKLIINAKRKYFFVDSHVALET